MVHHLNNYIKTWCYVLSKFLFVFFIRCKIVLLTRKYYLMFIELLYSQKYFITSLAITSPLIIAGGTPGPGTVSCPA